MSYSDHGNKKHKKTHEKQHGSMIVQHDEPYKQKMESCEYEKCEKKGSDKKARTLIYER